MSFLDKSIEAHVQWKIRLLTAVNGGDVPDRTTAASDSRCELGAWIAGDGKRQYGHDQLFIALQTAHTRFHEEAGRVVELTNAGKRADAKRSILEGDYLARSTEVVRAISAMKRSLA
jgi:methyl-accepting chemotaxis protein